MLSRDEHISLRMYAESIKVHFDDDGKKGNGGRVGGFAAAYMRLSKRADHKAPVYYDTRYDLVTEYANPKWNNGLKEHDGRRRQNNVTQEEIANTVNARQMHMVFRRERQYTKGGVVNVESTGVSLRPRGICSTLIQILESRIMGHVMVPEFRLLVFSGIMDAFQRWLISTTTSSSNSRRYKILLDVNNDLSHEEACSVIGANLHIVNNEDAVVISAYHDIIRKATTTTTTTTSITTTSTSTSTSTTRPTTMIKNDTNSGATTTTKKTTIPVPPMNLHQVVEINERLTRMMLHILERHKDFAEKRVTVHIERDQLYRQLQYKISSLNPSSLHIMNPDDVRLIGNGNTHDC